MQRKVKKSQNYASEQLHLEILVVTEKGRYVITFYTADAPWADLVVGQAALLRKGDVSAIEERSEEHTVSSIQYYTLSGLPVQPLSSGVYVRKSVLCSGASKCEVVIIK